MRWLAGGLAAWRCLINERRDQQMGELASENIEAGVLRKTPELLAEEGKWQESEKG